MTGTDLVLATQPVAAPEGLEAFTAWFVKNYPGPNTVIFDPNWHAPKIYRAALAAAPRPVSEPVAWMHPEMRWTHASLAYVAMHCRKGGPKPIPLFNAAPAEISDREARLQDSTAAMNSGSAAEPMTAAEKVLAWLLVEKIGSRDDCSYSPKFAQLVIEAYFDTAKALEVRVADLEAENEQLRQQVENLDGEAKDESLWRFWNNKAIDLQTIVDRLKEDATDLTTLLRSKANAIRKEYELTHNRPCDCASPDSALAYGRAQGLEIAAEAAEARKVVGRPLP